MKIDKKVLDNIYSKLVKKYPNYKEKKSEKKKLEKEFRKTIREIYSVFKLGKFKNYESILNHLSTKERFPFYKKFYSKIFSIVDPESILDLGCGLNPLLIYKSGFLPKKYLGIDIGYEEIEFLNEFFKNKNLNWKFEVMDIISNKNKIIELSKDFKTTFLLKMLPILEIQEKGISKYLINNLKSKYIVISFSRVSISGKRGVSLINEYWFEKEYNFLKKLLFPTEIVYILTK